MFNQNTKTQKHKLLYMFDYDAYINVPRYDIISEKVITNLT